MATVACVGISVRDYVFEVAGVPDVGHKGYADGFREVTGGLAANAAIAVARLGATARYVGRLGDDAAGAAILADLQAAGVDTTGVEVRPGMASPVSAVLVDRSGERTIVNHTADALFCGPDGDPIGDLAGVDAVLIDVRWPDGARRALEAAARKGIPSVFDFDRPMSHRGDELLAGASHVAFSRPALEATAGTADPAAALASVAAGTDAWLAVTAGPDGVYWLDGETVQHLPAFQVDVVDTTGAGDVFHGALAVALAEGMTESEAVRFASAAAAVKCTRRGGGSGAPLRSEVIELLAGQG